jgi:hypothetical protein
LLEEAGHAGTMDFHLQTANAEGAENDLSMFFLAIPAGFDPLDAKRRHGIDICKDT